MTPLTINHKAIHDISALILGLQTFTFCEMSVRDKLITLYVNYVIFNENSIRNSLVLREDVRKLISYERCQIQYF